MTLLPIGGSCKRSDRPRGYRGAMVIRGRSPRPLYPSFLGGGE